MKVIIDTNVLVSAILKGRELRDVIQFAQNKIPEIQQELHLQLLEKNQNNQLNESDRLLLKSLRVSADYLMLKKAYAYALLQWKGYSLPDFEQLVD
ncbi:MULTISPECIES: hypothetical protein [unclassified Nodularia (in: cyanobacteria)]|uniref:hypothetical protein n=1 Tax=unclassified Nodularia (in: cyanobacteria) TaxID=2656917 RepID=UPI00187F9411|nr:MULTISPECIES: hypothetical protein [unclassified Nodularia (in: cyanobacteria)]MBE9198655.1 hypothetical protein [Nodularia sp. LEGE 06071]MCC2691775.1 hypothetical protein [Nodularia sp. LEGE 04288]